MRVSTIAIAIALATTCSAPALADEADRGGPIVVIGQQQADTIENVPSTKVAVTAEQIGQKVNAVSVEDTLK